VVLNLKILGFHIETWSKFGTRIGLCKMNGYSKELKKNNRENSPDLIVMATKGRQGFLDVVRTSTTEQVLRRAPIPLLAVPAFRNGLS